MALKDILFVGDIHGSMTDLEHAFQEAARLGINNIVQVGDFWLYGEHELIKMKRVQNRVLDHTGIKIHLHFIDGNHEDYRLINPHLENTVELCNDLLYYHPRGTIFTINNITIGCFGGAVSIDKDWRKPGKTWFDDEIPTMSDTHRAITNFQNEQIDILITHDVPAYALKQVGQHDTKFDCDNSIKVRAIIEKLSEVSKAPIIIHGHWHHFAHKKYQLTIGDFEDKLETNVISLGKNSQLGAIVNIDDNGDTVNIVSNAYSNAL